MLAQQNSRAVISSRQAEPEDYLGRCAGNKQGQRLRCRKQTGESMTTTPAFLELLNKPRLVLEHGVNGKHTTVKLRCTYISPQEPGRLYYGRASIPLTGLIGSVVQDAPNVKMRRVNSIAEDSPEDSMPTEAFEARRLGSVGSIGSTGSLDDRSSGFFDERSSRLSRSSGFLDERSGRLSRSSFGKGSLLDKGSLVDAKVVNVPRLCVLCQCKGFVANRWNWNKCNSCMHWKTAHAISTDDAPPPTQFMLVFSERSLEFELFDTTDTPQLRSDYLGAFKWLVSELAAAKKSGILSELDDDEEFPPLNRRQTVLMPEHVDRSLLWLTVPKQVRVYWDGKASSSTKLYVANPIPASPGRIHWGRKKRSLADLLSVEAGCTTQSFQKALAKVNQSLCLSFVFKDLVLDLEFCDVNDTVQMRDDYVICLRGLLDDIKRIISQRAQVAALLDRVTSLTLSEHAAVMAKLQAVVDGGAGTNIDPQSPAPPTPATPSSNSLKGSVMSFSTHARNESAVPPPPDSPIPSVSLPSDDVEEEANNGDKGANAAKCCFSNTCTLIAADLAQTKGWKRDIRPHFDPVCLSESCYKVATIHATLQLQELEVDGDLSSPQDSKKARNKCEGNAVVRWSKQLSSVNKPFKRTKLVNELLAKNETLFRTLLDSGAGILRVIIDEAHSLPVEKEVVVRVALLGQVRDVNFAQNQYVTVTGVKGPDPVFVEECFLTYERESDVVLVELRSKGAAEPIGSVCIPLSCLTDEELNGERDDLCRWFALLDTDGVHNCSGYIALRFFVEKKSTHHTGAQDAYHAASELGDKGGLRPSLNAPCFATIERAANSRNLDIDEEGSLSSEDDSDDQDWVAMMSDPSINYRMDDASSVEPLDVSVFVGTWNCGNSPPPPDLSAWLGGENRGDACDIYCIASQECGYTAADDDLAGSSGSFDWICGLSRHMGRHYVMIKYHSLLHIRLAIFASKAIQNRISRISHHSVATGVGGVYGNKGGVITVIHVAHTSIGFVSSHLAAHQNMTAARNQHARDILKSSPSLQHCDHVFWAGDLNYRLSYGSQGSTHPKPSKAQFNEMVAMVQSQEFSILFAHDQLRAEMVNGRVFADFQEGNQPETWAPTFKVRKNPKLKYFSNRSPAYCDRVLWRSLPGLAEEVKLERYESVPAICSSDHKPVFAIFKLLNTALLLPLHKKEYTICSLELSGLSCMALPSILHIHSGETKEDETLLEGMLEKSGPNGPKSGFQQRYFVLSPQQLKYSKAAGEAAKGTINLDPQTVVQDEPASPKPFTFFILGGDSDRKYHIAAPSREELQKWKQAISEAANMGREEALSPTNKDERKSKKKGWGYSMRSKIKETVRGSTTNPYLAILSNLLVGSPLISPACKNTTKPEWGDLKLTTQLKTSNPERIRDERLHVNVMCQGNKGIDTLLCSGHISLKPAAKAASATPTNAALNSKSGILALPKGAGADMAPVPSDTTNDFDFTCNLSAHGSTAAGTLSGKVSLKFGLATGDQRFSRFSSIPGC